MCTENSVHLESHRPLEFTTHVQAEEGNPPSSRLALVFVDIPHTESPHANQTRYGPRPNKP